MEHRTDLPAQTFDVIRELHYSARVEARRLTAEAEEATQTELVWARFMDYLERDWPFHVLDLIEREAPRLKSMRAKNDPAVASIEQAYRWAKEEIDRILRRFPGLLEDACRSAGNPLDTDSRHPRYKLERGFFSLEIDEQKRVARLADYEGRLVEIPADIQAIVEAIKKEHGRIFGRPFSGSQFLKSLRGQYKAILKRDNLPDGSSVPIRQITRRLGKNVKGFRTDEFLVDLSRLAERGPLEIEGRRLDLQQTKDTSQGMLLYGGAARGYVGFILFKEM